MSNETDLDWLARNIHLWPVAGPESTYVFSGRNWFAALSCTVGGEFLVVNTKLLSSFTDDRVITKDQWLARRAELQNKPSWKDAPDWAEWLVQRDDGAWFWLSYEPKVDGDEWSGKGQSKSCFPAGDLGLHNILGDWRDTLERRPEKSCAEMEGGLVKTAFEPFVSMEDGAS